MITIILIAILAIGAYAGARRGLIIQLVHTVGYFVTLIVARLFYTSLAKSLEMLIPYPSDTQATQLTLYNLVKNVEFDKAFYNGLSFVLIVVIGWVITRIVAVVLHNLSHIPVLKQANALGGACLGFVCNWIGLFFLLSILSMIPMDAIQNLFHNHSFASFIVKNTPIFSQQVYQLWLFAH